jgi:hypothetical protein
MEAHMGLLERELQALRARLDSAKKEKSTGKDGTE